MKSYDEQTNFVPFTKSQLFMTKIYHSQQMV